MGKISYFDPDQGQKYVTVALANNGEIAATGETQETATVLKEGNSWLMGKAYTLPTEFTDDIRVWNVSGGEVQIFPAKGGRIDDGAVDEPLIATDRERVVFSQRAKLHAWSFRAV
jgi:hypothetical protein